MYVITLFCKNHILCSELQFSIPYTPEYKVTPIFPMRKSQKKLLFFGKIEYVI
jgi:hypothetical protein